MRRIILGAAALASTVFAQAATAAPASSKAELKPVIALLAAAGQPCAPARIRKVGKGPLPVEVACADGRDDDADGLVDCEDGECFAACTERCDDGVDDDGDGDVDCRDEDCWGRSTCDVPATVRECGRGRRKDDNAGQGERCDRDIASHGALQCTSCTS